MSRQAVVSLLPELKLSHLRNLLVRVGANTGGTKPVLINRITEELTSSEAHSRQHGRSKTTASGSNHGGKTRILSVDMGIKNLAFCVYDLRPGSTSAIHAWRRISLLSNPQLSSSPSAPPGGDTLIGTTKDTVADNEPFHPSSLSALAFNLVTKVLLPYQPDVILIERQRFRSGGSSAVQEWTVRVNMLESMIWAVLRTLLAKQEDSRQGSKELDAQGRGGSEVQVWAVSPQRVGLFWIHGGQTAESGTETVAADDGSEKKKGRVRKLKVEKKDKINFVRRWLSAVTSPQSSQSRLPAMLQFEKEAEMARLAFTEDSTKRRRKLKSEVEESNGDGNVSILKEAIGKLDDVADCLLQAAAWVQWQENKRTLAETKVKDVESVEKLLNTLV